MLQDLKGLKRAAEENIASSNNLQIIISDQLKSKIAQAYGAVSKEKIVVFDWGLRVTSQNGNVAFLPFQWFATIKHCGDYILALKEYAGIVDAFKASASAENRTLIDSILRQLPLTSWRERLTKEECDYVQSYLANSIELESDRKCFDDFLDGSSWLDMRSADQGTLQGKKLNRTSIDYITSAVSKIGLLLDVMSGRLDKFIEIYLENPDLASLVSQAQLAAVNDDSDVYDTGVAETRGVYRGVADNKVLYGAPGTGKSYEIDQIVQAQKHVSTVFHPDTQYSDFVGCLKPSMKGPDVEYKFREGPFCKALKLAHDNQGEHCYLVIEEINRASAAAVFGEVFQLLDRDADGSSKYQIDINDPDMLFYLLEHAPSVISNGQLRLPGNLSIYATMNSSDQAVMPMDTAFKRRWKFKYKPVDFSNCATGEFKVHHEEEDLAISWKDFAESVNTILVEQEIPEDRLLGPWFLKTEEIANIGSATEALSGKLFMYLWDDVLRHAQRSSVFDESIKNYGQLVDKFKGGKPVFSEQLFELFKAVNSAEAGNAEDVTEADEPSVTVEDINVI